MSKINHEKLNKLKNTEPYQPKPFLADKAKSKDKTITISETSTGSIKVQFKGDASPKEALTAMIKFLEQSEYKSLGWPTLYFGPRQDSRKPQSTLKPAKESPSEWEKRRGAVRPPKETKFYDGETPPWD